jgi:hypothetical protein
MKKLNCLSIQEKENTRLIYTEKTILGEAEYHGKVRSQLPVAELGLLLSMGVGEAYGGRRGWWGQVRPMEAVSHRPHARARQHETQGSYWAKSLLNTQLE